MPPRNRSRRLGRVRRAPLTLAAWPLMLLLLLSLPALFPSPSLPNVVAAEEAAAEAASEEEGAVRVEFEVQLAHDSVGKFVVEVHPSWAPLGSSRFLELVDAGESFWKGIRFFRVISGFMAQFGIPGKPEKAAEWKEKTLKDDPVVESNKRGYLSFATSGKDSRTTQMFINLVDNANLDGMGFSPFALVVEGMEDVVDRIYSGYGEGAPNGKGPEQGRIQSEGNRYLKRSFPMLSYVKSVRRLDGDRGGSEEGGGEGKEEL